MGSVWNGCDQRINLELRSSSCVWSFALACLVPGGPLPCAEGLYSWPVRAGSSFSQIATSDPLPPSLGTLWDTLRSSTDCCK